MHPNFDLTGEPHFGISYTLPLHFKGIALEGASILTAHNTAMGTIVFQEIVHTDFTIRFNQYNLLQPYTLNGTQEDTVLASIVALKNMSSWSFYGLGPAIIKNHEFILIHCKARPVKIAFEKPGNFQSLEISWPEKMLEDFLPLFTFLKPLLSKKESVRPFYVTPFPKTTSSHSLGLASDIIKFKNKTARAQYLLGHKIKGYQFSLLTDADRRPFLKKPIRKEDEEKILSLAEDMRNNPAKKFPGAEIVRDLGMNEKKLLKLFRELLGTTPYQYHLESRLREAHRLLEQTDLVTKEISDMVGYDRDASYVHKFGEFFGYPPSDLRKDS
jgi:AraC-like DNA-binding protein